MIMYWHVPLTETCRPPGGPPGYAGRAAMSASIWIIHLVVLAAVLEADLEITSNQGAK
jgi:hypothetical protein